MDYTNRIRDALQALGLPVNIEGCREAHRMTRAAEAVRIRVPNGEFEGCLDRENIERKILPGILKKHPKVRDLLKRLEEREEGFDSVCHDLDWFLEKVQELSGNRPLPFQLGVHVKNFSNGKSRFGFLLWEEGRYVIAIKETAGLDDWPLGRLTGKRQTYQTAFDAAMDGWLVD